MPVMTGTINPPKNRSNQIRILKIVKLSTNGMGRAEPTAKSEITQHVCSALGEL